MPRYSVHGSITFPCWIEVEASGPEEAQSDAEEASASRFEFDSSAGEVEFNVVPGVEVA